MKSNNKSRLKQEKFKLRRKQGWDKNLYRSRTNKKLSGVCGGIAEQLNVEPWIIRLLFVGSFFIIGGLSIILYIFATFVIAKRPKHQTPDMEYDEERHEYAAKTMFKYSASTSARLRKASERIDNALNRVGAMEGYVTSKQYELNKEFTRMQD
jgi:phage shock protein C